MEVEKRIPLSNIQSISKSYDVCREKVVADPYDTVCNYTFHSVSKDLFSRKPGFQFFLKYKTNQFLLHDPFGKNFFIISRLRYFR